MKLKEIREERNVTRQELADQVGVSVRTVGRWETGERLPDAARQERIAASLGVQVEELGWKKQEEKEVCKEDKNWWDDEETEEEMLLCAFRARPDRFNKSAIYFPPCLRESCSAYRNGKCTFEK